jgi:hypothetical protein
LVGTCQRIPAQPADAEQRSLWKSSLS